MNASQALSYRKPLKSSNFIEMFVEQFRNEVPLIDEDRILHYDIKNAVSFLQSFDIDESIL